LGKETPEAGTPEYNQLETLLLDASAEMRAVIGQELTRATSTVQIHPDGSEMLRREGRKFPMSFVQLPATPVILINEVQVDGVTIPPESMFLRYHTLYIPEVYYDSVIDVTYTHGFEELPEEIVKWTCVLAAATLSAAEKTGALGTTAGISQHSRTIDDYTEGWANYSGYKAPGMSVPPEIGVRLRAIYGGGGISVVSHR
jgi:hypothetical protein